MQKKIIALAVVGALAAAPAMAQTNVTVYGSIDMGFSHRGDSYQDSTSNKNSIDSGMAMGNRLGFKGVEDLGNGLKALFTLEAGFNGDDGTQGQGGRLFGRQAFVGLTSDYGTVIAGRLYTPHYSFLSALDPFKDGTVGRYSNVMGITPEYVPVGYPTNMGGNNWKDNLDSSKKMDDDYTGAHGLFNPQRVDNAVAYVSPTWFGGFNVTAAYSNNAYGQEKTGNKGDNRVVAILPRYTNGPIDIGVSFHQIRLAHGYGDDGASQFSQHVGLDNDQKITNWAVGGSYDFGNIFGDAGLKISAFYDHNKWEDFTLNSGAGTAATARDDIELKSWMIGAEMPIGKHTIMLSYNHSKLDAGDIDSDSTVKQWALGYKYSLSKRTSLYAAYANISQDDEGDSAVFGNRGSVGDNSNAGDSYQNGFQFGLNHTF
ncbi:MAG: porin [Zoogloeaceae bacterium]|jgi:predicted porin|nr:porin [Zoogloeaceae bacterium]